MKMKSKQMIWRTMKIKIKIKKMMMLGKNYNRKMDNKIYRRRISSSLTPVRKTTMKTKKKYSNNDAVIKFILYQ